MKHDVDAKNSSSVSRPSSAPSSRGARGNFSTHQHRQQQNSVDWTRRRPTSAGAGIRSTSSLNESMRESLFSLGITDGSTLVEQDLTLEETDLSHTVSPTLGGAARLYTHDRPFSSMEAWATNVSGNRPFKALVESNISAIPERKLSSVAVLQPGPASKPRRRPSSAASRTASATYSRSSTSANGAHARRRRQARRSRQTLIPFSNLHAPNEAPFSETPSIAARSSFAKMLRSVPTRGPTDARLHVS